MAPCVSVKAEDTRPGLIVETSPACINKEVTVKVSNQKGAFIEGVDIDVINRNRKVAYGKTDDSGVFVFTAKELGANQMILKKTNYKDSKIQLNVSNCVVTTISTTTIEATTLYVTTYPRTTTLPPVITTTTYGATTTTMQYCNFNTVCDQGENYNKCPNDCLSGSLDGLCDRKWDTVCDPDCYRKDDNDCLCNNNAACEPEFENVVNCPADCPSGTKDGVCDGITDSKCDPDCPGGEGDTDCKKADYSTMAIPLAIILILFGAFAAFNMKREASSHHVERAKEDSVDLIKIRLRNGEDPEVIRKELAASGQESLLEKAEKTIWE